MGLFHRKTGSGSTGDDGRESGAAQTPDAAELTGDYAIDPAHSEIGFSARHAMVTTVRGQFRDFEGSIHLDGSDPGRSTAEVTIKVASIDTNQEQRDAHLRTNDFFEADAYPEITFRSSAVEQVDAETFRLTGDLTIKGTTKPVTLDVTFNGAAKDPMGNERIGFEGTTTVNRSEWGLTYNAALETGGMLVSEKARLSFDVSAIRRT